MKTKLYNSEMVKKALNLGVGFILIGAGFLLSPNHIVNFLRPFQNSDFEALTTGALLFKLGLIITGFFIILLGRFVISFPQQNTAPPDKQGRHGWAVFIVILCVAALLRIYKLDEGLWLDEILTQVNYTKDSFREIFSTYDSQNQHFLYSLLTRVFYLLFGESAWSL
jgi:hypothetical protein